LRGGSLGSGFLSGDKGLREVSGDAELTVLRLLCDRRDELSRARAPALNRMHRLFLELVPGGARR